VDVALLVVVNRGRFSFTGLLELGVTSDLTNLTALWLRMKNVAFMSVVCG